MKENGVETSGKLRIHLGQEEYNSLVWLKTFRGRISILCNINTHLPLRKCLPSPVRQQEGTNVRDWWGSRPKLGQCHNMFKGDVCLRAHIDHTHVLRRSGAVLYDSRRGSGGGTSENLDNDRVSPDGLHHCFIMFDLGQTIYLGGNRKQIVSGSESCNVSLWESKGNKPCI